MKRCLGWTLLLMAGILLGVASSSYQITQADPPEDEAAADAGDANSDALAEMKEIKTQLKEINAYLRSGVVKVVVVMNPDKD